MESRKRSYTEDVEHPRSKKRAIEDERGSPAHVNGGAETDEPKDNDNLETFRKDAIYRRMKHYSRENDRSQSRIAELERRRDTCEAGVAALEACWNQLISTIRSLVKPESLPSVDEETQDLFDLTLHDMDPTYVTALRSRMQATEQLVTAIVHLGSREDSVLEPDDVYKMCRKTETECAFLRSEVSLMRTKLHDTEEEKEKLHEQLVAAEKRADRLQSKTITTIYPQSSIPQDDRKSEELPETPPPSAHSPPASNGVPLIDAEEQRMIASVREKRITELTQDNTNLRQEVQATRLQLAAPSDSFITQTPYYKILLEHTSRLQHTVSEDISEINRTRQEVVDLKMQRREWENSIISANEQAVQELKVMLTKRDNENLRLREQRDQQLSELNERKHKDHIKIASLNEFKALAETRSERISVLQSELTRLRARLAANAGDKDLLSFIFQGNAEDITYVDDLKKRLAAAENRAVAVENSLSFFQEEHPDIVQHMRAEAEAREQLASVTKLLQKYQLIYGDSSSALMPDMRSLSTRLQEREQEVQNLRLLEKQHEQAESALYAELDKLSAAWEALDRQVKSKVFDLSAMEEKLVKSGHEKAKSENKFYSAMRDKESTENERKNLARNLEKQAKVVEKLMETEKSLTVRLGDLEKEAILLRRALETQKARVSAFETENAEWKMRAEGERKRADDIRATFREQEKNLERHRAEIFKTEEELVRKKIETERQAAKLKSMAHAASSSSSSKETELQNEINKCMSILKCSTCKMNMRNTVITKCMHSFCRSCIDARISNRQRKCPACNLAFSQGEVQTLYFQ